MTQIKQCAIFISMVIATVFMARSVAATPLVTSGDQLVFSQSALNEATAVKVVEWSQSFRSRKAKYIQITGIVKRDQPHLLMLFMAQEIVPAVQEQCKNGKCTMKVDSRFQYGQNKEKTMRFLVLHDKSNKPYQHRFISTSTLSTFASGAEAMAKSASALGVVVPSAGLIGLTGGKIVSSLKNVIGDPLRDF